jgi:hypothetical protein
MNRTPDVMAAAIAAAVLLTGCSAETVRTAGAEGPSAYITEEPGGITAIDSWITEKNHYPGIGSGGEDRWEFCFDSADGGWTCLPVSEADYDRFGPGDRIQVMQKVGEVAVVTSGSDR